MIVLIGPKSCPNCNEVGEELDEAGIKWRKDVLDYAIHGDLVAQASREGYKEAPVAAEEKPDKTLEYIAAGRSKFATTAIKSRARRLAMAQ